MFKTLLPLIRTHVYNIALALVIGTYFFFGLQHIGQFVTADEHYWVYERIPQYWEAWADGEWKKTLINDKPGVTLALLSGVSLLFEPQPETHRSENKDRTLVYDVNRSEQLYTAFRFPLLVVNGLIIVFLFYVISRLTTRFVALLSTTLIALSPILLGISQIVNPDTLLWSLGGAALFSYFAFLTLRERKFFWFTIFFTGFALLTKYVAFILIPLYLALTVLRFFTLQKGETDTLTSDLFSWGQISLGSALILVAFLPALLVDAKYIAEIVETIPDKAELSLFAGSFLALFLFDVFVLKKKLLLSLKNSPLRKLSWTRVLSLLFLSVFMGIIIVRMFFPETTLFTSIPFDIKDLSDARYHASVPNFFESFILEWNPLVFSLTPVVLFGFFLLTLLHILTQKKSHSFFVGTLLFFFLTYSILLIVSNTLTTPRYSILLYPFFSFLAALGFSSLFRLSSRAKYAFFFLIFIGSDISLAQSAPFYFNYTNAFLPKSALIHDAWGYGGYEAAQYLNSLPDAKNLTVWIDYYGVCEFFVGRCLNAYTFDGNVVQPDYYVLTRRGQMRYMSRADRWERLSGLTAHKYYGITNPAWQLNIGGRPGNFIKVVKVHEALSAAIITDIDHCPSREAASEKNLQDFIAFSQSKQADFIVSLGDNASHRLRDCSNTGDEDARYIADKLRSSGLPTHLVLGDHDIASSIASYHAWLQTIGREKTYYSFDIADVHVVILDTVLGGSHMRLSCQDSPLCAALEVRLADIRTLSTNAYRTKYTDALPTKSEELALIQKKVQDEVTRISLTRSFGNRDRGRIDAEQLDWLKVDIEKTPSTKILLFSDHPLFPFESDRKRYDILNGDVVRSILENSPKEIVSISGEAHVWHEETLNDIHYYIIDEFRKANGSWAHFSWGKNGFQLEQVTHE